ncbi:hypothetical protein CEXT_720291 [Caerostris extrusa]|uniref:Uncharacterized protein n=1 Tax=Caerostris extrusa TaxID=172846 RepID=A0AAV4U218_CAEEX|nr:hypothetical protein CEXT_720291 [Caerostris extrusa]
MGKDRGCRYTVLREVSTFREEASDLVHTFLRHTKFSPFVKKCEEYRCEITISPDSRSLTSSAKRIKSLQKAYDRHFQKPQIKPEQRDEFIISHPDFEQTQPSSRRFIKRGGEPLQQWLRNGASFLILPFPSFIIFFSFPLFVGLFYKSPGINNHRDEGFKKSGKPGALCPRRTALFPGANEECMKGSFCARG